MRAELQSLVQYRRANLLNPADVAPLAGKRSAELRDLGRLPYPMVRRRGEPGFTRTGWDEALARFKMLVEE